MTRMRFTHTQSLAVADEMTRLQEELAELKVLAKGAVEEFPIASGLWTDSDGQDGYGYLKALRLFLQEGGADVGGEKQP